MTPKQAARELLAAQADYDRVNAEHRELTKSYGEAGISPVTHPKEFARETELAKARALARNRLEAAKEYGRMIASALLAKEGVE